MMAGPDPDMKAEAAYLRLLEDADGFHLAGNTQTLFGSDGAESLIFHADFDGADETELRDRLTPLQYEVTQHEGTEPPFDNDYWDEHRDGIYVDVVTGDPLFSSRDKYDSGTGWPSFTKPLRDRAVTTRADGKLLGSRTEVRGAASDAHLGHVFPDGPKPTGRRYCMNSAALRFVPREELQAEGYGEYEGLFGGEEE